MSSRDDSEHYVQITTLLFSNEILHFLFIFSPLFLWATAAPRAKHNRVTSLLKNRPKYSFGPNLTFTMEIKVARKFGVLVYFFYKKQPKVNHHP
jgi:hypothetical protein